MMSTDAKLAVNRFHVDEGQPHIELGDRPDPATVRKLVLACPAGLYRQEDDGVRFDAAGCLECGTCRILGSETALARWSYPQGGMGVDYRYG